MSRGKSTLFWILLVAGGACAVCSLATLALMGLGLVADDEVTTAPVGIVTLKTKHTLPTGETPDLYPGTPGWLPSGRGVAIPAAELVDGRPEGLWWHWQVQSNSKMNAGVILFLPDGTRASNPRPGGGNLFDLEGQRAQRGNTGLGTFEIDDGKLTQRFDGFTSTDPYTTGSDSDGTWFKTGAAKHLPLAPPSQASLVGTWETPGGKFVFRDDGTYESGLIAMGGGTTLAAGSRGGWQLDGYLIALQPTGAPAWITTIGMTGDDFLVMGSAIYNRR